MKIGYISWYSPSDRKSSSGTTFKIFQELEAIGYEVVWIPVRRTALFDRYTKLIYRLNKKFKKKIDVTHSVIGAKLQSDTIDKKLVEKCDMLFAPFCSEGLYSLKTDKPIIYLSDATFAAMVGYYFNNLSKCAIRQGNKVELKAQNKSTAIIVSSEWAKRSVINDYHQNPNKVYVVEFGANIDDNDIIEKRYPYNGHLDILFLGVDWERKGGRTAVDTCRWLNDNGVPSTIHIVGISELEEETKSLPYVDYIGFLNKNIPAQYSKLVEVIRKCRLMLLPTVAECSAIAFCEASAYGLPVFSHITGGTQNYVFDGQNGYLLPPGSTPADFGKKIKDSLESGELEHMSETAKEVYREKLNWKVWGEKVRNIISKSCKFEYEQNQQQQKQL